MVRKHVALMVLVMLAVFAVACGGNNSSSNSGGGGGSSGSDMSTPQGAMNAMKDAWTSMDAARFEALYTAESWKDRGVKMKKELEEMKGEIESVTLTWNESDIKVEGDKASVRAKLKFKMKKDGKEDEDGEGYEMVKVDGKWKFTK